MTVHDVVLVVDPGADCSYPRGVTWVEAAPPDRARELAAGYTRHAAVGGVRYAVEAHDEACPDRAPAPRGGRTAWGRAALVESCPCLTPARGASPRTTPRSPEP